MRASCSLEKIGHKILIDEADKALHCSKVKGRNQVNVFDKQICSLNNELIIIDSLKDKDAKEFARLAVDAFRKEDIEEFVKNIKLAFDCAFQTWKEKYTIRMGVAIRGITIPELIKNNILDFNLVEFVKFESFLPRIIWFESGTYQVSIKRSYALPRDKENVNFCLRFFINALIRFKQQADI